MNQKTISVVALSNHDYDSFADKLAAAVRWLELAALQGAELAVLPELLNHWRGDGVGHAHPLTYEEAALDDWQRQTAPLIEAAARLKLAVTIPVSTRERGVLTNSFFLVGNDGKLLGRYQKQFLTPAEQAAGFQPGQPAVIEWAGLKVGGAICFDTNFPQVFASQAALGAQLFLVPSLWPGGSQLNHFAFWHSIPVALSYPAWSRIIGIDGREIVEGGYRHETLRFGFGMPVYTAIINFDRMRFFADGNQAKIVELQRRHGRNVRIVFDQLNCSFYIESLASELTTSMIAHEFEMTPAGEYFDKVSRFTPKRHSV